jgi:hypothetical protein
LTIAFSKTNRTINVKYDHTPIHKTVAQLFDFFKPPVPEPLAPPEKPVRLAKVKKKKEPKPSKKRDAAAGDKCKGNSTPKKKRKNDKDGENEPVGKEKSNGNTVAPDAPMLPPDFPGTLPVGKEGRTTYGTQRSSSGSEAFNNYPQRFRGDNSTTIPTVMLNVPPEEAVRRQGVATKLLSDAGVDPKSLSLEQFGIFTNQPPDLQKESLNMLVKYGAERLRIVHPTGGEGISSPAPTASSSHSPAVAAATEATPIPSKKKKRRKSEVIPADESLDASVIYCSAATPSAETSKIKKRLVGSRIVACVICRKKRRKVSLRLLKVASITKSVQCTKELPSCALCIANGFECIYLESRGWTKNTARDVNAEESTRAEGGETLDLDSAVYANITPVSGIVTGSLESMATHSGQDFFQADLVDLTYSQDMTDMSHQAASSASELSFPEIHSHDIDQAMASGSLSYPEVPYVQPQPVETAMPSTTKDKRRKECNTGASPGKDTPLSSQKPVTETPTPLPVISDQSGFRSPSWPNVSNQGTTATAVQTASTTTTHTQVAKQRRSYDQHGAAAESEEATSVPHTDLGQRQLSSLQAGSSLSQFQAPVQTSSAKSRQVQRHQNQTSGPDQTSARVSPAATVPQLHRPTTHETYNAMEDISGISDYDHDSNHFSPSMNEQSNQILGYHPYGGQAITTQSSSYPYDGYNTHTITETTLPMATPATQAVSISYSSSTTPSNQWSADQSRNSQSYGTNNSAATGTSYTQQPASSAQQSASQQSFIMLAKANSSRSSAANYNQQSQSQQLSYNSYTQEQLAQQQNQDWYGFESNTHSLTPTNASTGYAGHSNSVTNYNAGSSSTNTRNYQQQHQGLQNGPAHGGYGSGGRLDAGDEASLDFFRISESSNTRD